jgi:hypothetical protein
VGEAVPGAILTQVDTEWVADQFFALRAALVGGVVKESATLVEDLKDAAGDRCELPPPAAETHHRNISAQPTVP